MVTMLTIPSLDGKSFHAYCARPQQSSAPAIIVCQEIFGVNAGMRKICDDFAAKGYIALCPDLFWRLQPDLQLSDSVPAELEQAFALYRQFDRETGALDLLACLRALRGMEGCNGAVGIVGYCLGGYMSYLMMTRSDLDCGVSYYGVGLETLQAETADIRRPLLLHIAGKDQLVTPEAQTKILQTAAKNPNITSHVYPELDHAFTRVNGANYNQVGAALAAQRTADFFASHLRQ
jgi:carboxymethylenebutenolidase